MTFKKFYLETNRVTVEFIFFLFIIFSFAEDDSTKKAFFGELNISLHSEYIECTSDSTPLTLDSLIRWKKNIDSITFSPGYTSLLNKYSEETGIPSTLAKPCDVIKWMQIVKEELKKTGEMLAYEKQTRDKKREDSLLVLSELKNVKTAPYDLMSIPFGVSKRTFLIMTQKKGISVVDSGKFLYCDSVPFGIMSFKGFFHFSKDNKYVRYELESSDCSSDSLDIWARAMMEYMSAQIENKTGKPPDHIYRISRFDIVAGRFTVCKIWNFLEIQISSGLSRRKNRFYAKMTVN